MIPSSIRKRSRIGATSTLLGFVRATTKARWAKIPTPFTSPLTIYVGKRTAETLCYCYMRQHNVQVRIARIFNTFGPRMNPADGRVVSNFIMQALEGKALTVYGDGKQTRSFQYVHDLIDGLLALMQSNELRPVNIGNPQEFEIGAFAEYVRTVIAKDQGMPPVPITHLPATEDDPKQRRPDISKAWQVIRWRPKFTMQQGLYETVEFFKLVVQRQHKH